MRYLKKMNLTWIKRLNATWLRPLEFFLVLVGVTIAVVTFLLEADDRREQRLIAGWQLLSEKTPGASGKRRALMYLHQNNEPLVAVNLSFVRHGAPVYLQSLDLFDEETERGVFFSLSSFAGAILQGADLRKSTFENSCLYRTEFGSAKLAGSDFSYADLTYANLRDAEMADAILLGANLSGAAMEGATGLTQHQLDKAYYCMPYGPPSVPCNLKPPPEKRCVIAQGCAWSEVNTTPRVPVQQAPCR